ncbi:PREDICTED: zinc finger protein ZAT5 [Nelumbo nucifera]|uniref:C2H2-type domain-containing protein n=2 Tax=Nelumbo nucifera TaxID=4432 RepID=A0A823A1B6_NELNU|nr:PREDICTED: zinc finger protein ZAT5 [Nelumbo nucifera]DAD48796.1 TPA_asm: hypothetical protein HUJ06_018733 [Nelumbo nucifera]
MERDMEVAEEVVGSNDQHSTHVVKGKRTKRQRPPSPFSAVAMATSSSSGGGGGDGGAGGGDDGAFHSPTTSAEFAESTEEEEDMANCLILLAQGHSRDSPKRIEEGGGMEMRISSRRFAEAATTTSGKGGFYVYECKTCNRCFPSFQALGGHRASHKKPKAMAAEEKKALMVSSPEEDEAQFNNVNSSPHLHLQIAGNKASVYGNKSRVHECSICGSEFSSGQALGGHMRRHRSAPTTATTITTSPDSPEAKKPRTTNVLSLDLDLNLPAPTEDVDHREPKFPFSSKQQPSLLFSASALVDCHY